MYDEKELRRQGKPELAALIIRLDAEKAQLAGEVNELTEVNASQAKKIQELNEKLEAKELNLAEAGTLAEASLRVNSVFEAADAAASQYLENIKRKEDEADLKVEAIIAEARMQAANIVYEAQQQSAKIKSDANMHWSEVSSTLERFYSNYRNIKDNMPAEGAEIAAGEGAAPESIAEKLSEL